MSTICEVLYNFYKETKINISGSNVDLVVNFKSENYLITTPRSPQACFLQAEPSRRRSRRRRRRRRREAAATAAADEEPPPVSCPASPPGNLTRPPAVGLEAEKLPLFLLRVGSVFSEVWLPLWQTFCKVLIKRLTTDTTRIGLMSCGCELCGDHLS